VNGWFSILAASALGSLHCVGMCGGLVSFYAANEEPAASRAATHAAYHSMRLVAYVTLGAVAGGLGSALDLVGSRVGLGDLGLFLAGLTLLFWAAPRLLSRRSAGAPISLGRHAQRRSPLLQRLERVFVSLASHARQRPPLWRAGALGLASALLPCGWLYAFVVLAAGTGSAGGGALLMLAFWAGTVPALLGLGVGIGRLSAPLRARLPRLSAGLVLVACAVTVAQRWPLATATETAGAQREMSCHGAH
jgi:sulfite exporter TauE/SafE